MNEGLGLVDCNRGVAVIEGWCYSMSSAGGWIKISCTANTQFHLMHSKEANIALIDPTIVGSAHTWDAKGIMNSKGHVVFGLMLLSGCRRYQSSCQAVNYSTPVYSWLC